MTGYIYKNVKNLNKFVKVRGYMVHPGDYILYTAGIFADVPMEVLKVYPEKNCLKVKAPMFDGFIDMDISMDDVVLTRP